MNKHRSREEKRELWSLEKKVGYFFFRQHAWSIYDNSVNCCCCCAKLIELIHLVFMAHSFIYSHFFYFGKFIWNAILIMNTWIQVFCVQLINEQIQFQIHWSITILYYKISQNISIEENYDLQESIIRYLIF